VDNRGEYSLYSFETEFLNIFEESGYEHSITADDASSKPQILYLYKYLKGLQCASILVEHIYVDHDYLDDYCAYYARCYSQYRRQCRRAHFFKEQIEDIDFDKLATTLEPSLTDKLKDSYLGYVVLRPLPDAVVGKTVLATWDDRNEPRHYSCVRSYEANLFGLRLQIDSLASQEQDTILAACATVSLWSAFQKVAPYYHTHIPTPSEITKAATQYTQTARPIPSRGLSIEQICHAISENGLVPEVYDVNRDTPLNSLIYAYVSGRLPVILGMRDPSSSSWHAVTICGYRLEDTVQCPSETAHTISLRQFYIGRRIKEFYVHDDNLGPFTRLDSVHNSQASVSQRLNPRTFRREMYMGNTLVSEEWIPHVLIVPVYHKVRLRFATVQDALNSFDSYIRSLNVILPNGAKFADVEWDVRLMDITQLRDWAFKDQGISESDKLSLLMRSRPRYVWVSTAYVRKTNLISVLSDATDMDRSFSLNQIVCHGDSVKPAISAMLRTRDPGLKVAKMLNIPYRSRFVKLIQDTFLA